MKILISPAKSLNLDPLPTKIKSTDIIFKDEAWEIAKVLKQKSPRELSELMNISSKLAELNWKRNQEYTREFTNKNSKQAIYSFNGEVYNGINVNTISETGIEFLQENLRILSGQYGLLRPLDLIMPYRLEMGTRLSIDGSKNLYDFWVDKISKQLNTEINENDIIINLASNEYFKSVKKNLIKAEIITPIFKDYKDGKLKTISFFAKKARGQMVRYIADNQVINNIEELKEFTVDGYIFDPKLSDNKNLIFIR